MGKEAAAARRFRGGGLKDEKQKNASFQCLMSPFGRRIVSPNERTGHERKAPMKARALAGAPPQARMDKLAQTSQLGCEQHT